MIGAGVTWWERWLLRPVVVVFLAVPHELRMALRRRRAARRTVEAVAREAEEIDVAGDAVTPLARAQAAGRARRLREIAEGESRPMIRHEDIRRVGCFCGRAKDDPCRRCKRGWA